MVACKSRAVADALSQVAQPKVDNLPTPWLVETPVETPALATPDFDLRQLRPVLHELLRTASGAAQAARQAEALNVNAELSASNAGKFAARYIELGKLTEPPPPQAWGEAEGSFPPRHLWHAASPPFILAMLAAPYQTTSDAHLMRTSHFL